MAKVERGLVRDPDMAKAETTIPVRHDSTGHNASRARDLGSIARSLGPHAVLSDDMAVVAAGDSLSLLGQLPPHSVSLVLTDPPYHVTKKANIVGDTEFEHDRHYLAWMEKHARAWKRVLRPNGSLFCFCATAMSARLEVMLSTEFKPLAHVVWTKPNEPGFDGWKGKTKKEALRQWYAHSERILFMEPAAPGNLHRSPFANYLRQHRKAAGLTAHKLAEITGSYGNVNHGGAVSNWETGRNIPSRAQYARICDAILATGRVHTMLCYEDAVRPFNVDASVEFTDVWGFPSVRPYKGKHPAEKPTSLLRHAISATTYPGDIVLDSCAGSGSTAVAALSLGRRSVSIEIDARWVESILRRIDVRSGETGTATGLPHEHPATRRIARAAQPRPSSGGK